MSEHFEASICPICRKSTRRTATGTYLCDTDGCPFVGVIEVVGEPMP